MSHAKLAVPTFGVIHRAFAAESHNAILLARLLHHESDAIYNMLPANIQAVAQSSMLLILL